MWGGRFSKPLDEQLKAFNASIHVDQRLAEVDVQGSQAHARSLVGIGVLSDAECTQICNGLDVVLKHIQADPSILTIDDEDIHMNIERLLHSEIGAVAGKLHTGRSRNDQVATDMHLYSKEQSLQISQKLKDLILAFTDVAEKNTSVLMPGYTHLQQAQPIRFSHHMMAYASMFKRDFDRINDAIKRLDISPLGAGALAGTGFPVDRRAVAKDLGFSGIYMNSMDAVSDRDYVLELLSIFSIVMLHISRLCEELILWSTQEFGFITMDDSFCTGSSMMPQKKNPDIPELLRGKAGRVIGSLNSLMITIKSLPLTYNKDMQEDKEGFFDALTTMHQCLDILPDLLRSITLHDKTMLKRITDSFCNATELADFLVDLGMPFREAHHHTGALVKTCIDKNCFLMDLPLSDYQAIHPKMTDEIFTRLQPEYAVEKRSISGGTSLKSVLEQITVLKESLHTK